MVILFENSSDLRSGRRPVSKSDEFSKSITTIDEIRRGENTTFPIHRYTYWDFESTTLLCSTLNIRVLELEDISAAARAVRWRQGTPMAEARLQ